MKYKKRQLEHVDLGEELVLCGVPGDQLHRLNRTASTVWKLCDGQRGVEEIALCLAREFEGMPIQEIEDDVRVTLQEMKTAGIIDTVG